MSFSSIAGEQRHREAKALRSFLVFSLIGSFSLHICALASGIGNFLAKVPELEEEPIELTFVEPEEPKVQETPPPKQIKQQPANTVKVPSPPPIRETTPVRKVTETPKTPPKIQPLPDKPEQTRVEPPKPIANQPKVVTEKPVQNIKPETSSASTSVSSEQLRQSLSDIRDSRNSQANSEDNSGTPTTLTGNNPSSTIAVGSGSGSGIASSAGSGTRSATGNGSGRRKRETFATAPTTPKLPTDSTGDDNGRAACRQCDAKYPEQAKKHGIEGRVEVAVDTDENGNVTNVRVTKSSGNRELDEAHARQAREWKLKPTRGGRQGVTIATEYALRGSRRHREVKERQRRREQEQRNQNTAATTSNHTSNTTPRQQVEASASNTDIPTRTRIRRPRTQTTSPATTPSSSQQSNIYRHLRRNTAESSSATSRQVTPTRFRRQEQVTPNNGVRGFSQRRKRRTANTPNNSNTGNRLQDALRRRQQTAPTVTPAAPPAPSGTQ
ncbi:MAG: energy transducer TonB [Fischerella sp.]|nr:energy transducer TonB [Fischerella sp.]